MQGHLYATSSIRLRTPQPPNRNTPFQETLFWMFFVSWLSPFSFRQYSSFEKVQLNYCDHPVVAMTSVKTGERMGAGRAQGMQ